MDFLTEQQQAATHFIIGLYITYYPDEFKRIFDSGDDIAVHTYTHPHMSSLSNETTAVSVYEQAYIFPRGIRTLVPTSTTYGISMKDIIGVLHLLST